MTKLAEWEALTRVYDLDWTLWYEVTVKPYPGLDSFAQSIHVRYGLKNPEDGRRGAPTRRQDLPEQRSAAELSIRSNAERPRPARRRRSRHRNPAPLRRICG